MQSLLDVQTPCLVVDRKRLTGNVHRLQKRFANTEVKLRPHLKTIKSIEAARFLFDPGQPATVSTLKEAQVFGQAGFTDLLYAVAISPAKLDQVSFLRRSGIDLKIITDNIAAAEAIAAHCRETGDAIPTLIELDVDRHRGGVSPDRPTELVTIGAALTHGARLEGVLTHAGESYNLSDEGALKQAAEGERSGALRGANSLRRAGLPCPIVSIGSTPTAFSLECVDGVNEVRAGVYMFFDLVQAGIGVCSIDDIALSVLATVIGRQTDKGWILVDCGWTAISSDCGTACQATNQHMGLVCDLTGRPFGDLVLLHVNQEHGVIAVRPGSQGQLPDLPVGSRVRILPNHACATAAQHDKYQIVDESSDVVEVWPRFNGWEIDMPLVAGSKGELAVIGGEAVRTAASRELASSGVRDAFRAIADGNATLFPVVTATVRAPETALAIKSGVNVRDGIVGLKVGTYWPDNAHRFDIPNHHSTTVLLDNETGATRAIINARDLNGLRTAAANAVATKALARPDAEVLTILGAGHQAGYEVRAVCDVRPIKKIILWARARQQAEALASSLTDLTVDQIVIVDDVNDAVSQADIITTVTTARSALFTGANTPPGVHISAMGADSEGKQELDCALVKTAMLFADAPAQSATIGEFQHVVQSGMVSVDSIVPIGKVLTGEHPGRTSEHEITIFDSSGVAIQDLNVAQRVLDECLKNGRAKTVLF